MQESSNIMITVTEMMRLSIISTLSETIRRRASAVWHFNQNISIFSADRICKNLISFIKSANCVEARQGTTSITALDKQKVTNLRDNGAAEE